LTVGFVSFILKNVWAHRLKQLAFCVKNGFVICVDTVANMNSQQQ